MVVGIGVGPTVGTGVGWFVGRGVGQTFRGGVGSGVGSMMTRAFFVQFGQVMIVGAGVGA